MKHHDETTKQGTFHYHILGDMLDLPSVLENCKLPPLIRASFQNVRVGIIDIPYGIKGYLDYDKPFSKEQLYILMQTILSCISAHQAYRLIIFHK